MYPTYNQGAAYTPMHPSMGPGMQVMHMGGQVPMMPMGGQMGGAQMSMPMGGMMPMPMTQMGGMMSGIPPPPIAPASYMGGYGGYPYPIYPLGGGGPQGRGEFDDHGDGDISPRVSHPHNLNNYPRGLPSKSHGSPKRGGKSGKSGKSKFGLYKREIYLKSQIYKVLKVQAFLRGCFARKVLLHRAIVDRIVAQQLTRQLMVSYIEDEILPDLVFQVLTYNRVSDDYTLFSDSYNVLIQIRTDIFRDVTQKMMRESVSDSIDFLIQHYLRGRYKESEIEEQDPLHMLASHMINKQIELWTREITKECVREEAESYIYYSQGLLFMNRSLLPMVLGEVAEEAMEDALMEDIFMWVAHAPMHDIIHSITNDDIVQRENKLIQEEVTKIYPEYLDRIIMKICLEQMSKLYEEEEKLRRRKEEVDRDARDRLAAELRNAKQKRRIQEEELIDMASYQDFNRAKLAYKDMAGGIMGDTGYGGGSRVGMGTGGRGTGNHSLGNTHHSKMSGGVDNGPGAGGGGGHVQGGGSQGGNPLREHILQNKIRQEKNAEAGSLASQETSKLEEMLYRMHNK